MATEFDRGFHQGWLAASEALLREMDKGGQAPQMAMAGMKPARRRGRPPKHAAAEASAPILKRGPGRPRKNP